MSAKANYKRVVLKLSGEMLCPPGGSGIDAGALAMVADEMVPVVQLGVQVAVVVGGGNFFRARQLQDTPQVRRVTADYMGMLATTMNALALRDALEHRGQAAEVLGAIFMECVCDPVDIRRAVEHLQAGRVVVLAGGTGRPFVTTDTCAALRACELEADIVLKGTKVNGVFDSDPQTNPHATRYDRLTYDKVLADKLGVMDMTAISLCREHNVPILVFQLSAAGSLAAAVRGEDVGTFISG